MVKTSIIIAGLLCFMFVGCKKPPAKAPASGGSGASSRPQPLVDVFSLHGENLDELIVSPGRTVEHGKPIEIKSTILPGGAKSIKQQLVYYRKHPDTQPSSAERYFDSTRLLYTPAQVRLFDSGSIRRVFSLSLCSDRKAACIYTQTTILAPGTIADEPPLEITWNDWKAFDAAKREMTGTKSEPTFWLSVKYYTFSNARLPSFCSTLTHDIELNVVPEQWELHRQTPTSFESVPVDTTSRPRLEPTAEAP